MHKLKILPILFYCLGFALWSEAQSMDNKSDILESATVNRTAADIAEEVKKEFKDRKTLLDSAKEKHIVAFLGKTKAGKSTLVNWLAGKKIKVDGEDYVLDNANDEGAMKIGTKGDSTTLYPQFIDIDIEDLRLRFFDLPGSDDTGGSARNLVNAAFIRKILQDAASVRFVFVVGRNEFEDEGIKARQILHSLGQLFVFDQSTDLVDNGVLIATKVGYTPQPNMPDSLLKKAMTEFIVKRTAPKHETYLKSQLEFWNSKNKLCWMFNPDRHTYNNAGLRDWILKLIRDAEGVKVREIDVSALYPLHTHQDLKKMFLIMLEEKLVQKLGSRPATLMEYNQELEYYTESFWLKFSTNVCAEGDAVGLLKEFCRAPYDEALRDFIKDKEEKLKQHVLGLEGRFVGALKEALIKKWEGDRVALTESSQAFEYNQVLEYYTSSEDFWSTFSEDVCKNETEGDLLKKAKPYTDALKALKGESTGELNSFIQMLEGMFVSFLEKDLIKKCEVKLETLTQYDMELGYYKDFWSKFSEDVCCKNGTGLKGAKPYAKALEALEVKHAEKITQRIQELESRKQERQGNIEKRTREKTEQARTPSKPEDIFVPFDFAYHREFYNKVCGTETIDQLATDPLEQKAVQDCCAKLISQHSHDQMMRWYQESSGVNKLIQRIDKLEQELVKERTARIAAEQKAAKARQDEEAAREAKYQAMESNLTAAKQNTEKLSEQLETTAKGWKLNALEKRLEVAEVRPVPPIACGYEQVYQKLLKGVLVYNKHHYRNEIKLPIAALWDPLEGTFNLSLCGDAGKYLNISTGYRKEYNPENKNKVEIWIAPRFLVEREINEEDTQYKTYLDGWPVSADIRIIWAWGSTPMEQCFNSWSSNDKAICGQSLAFTKKHIKEASSKHHDSSTKFDIEFLS